MYKNLNHNIMRTDTLHQPANTRVLQEIDVENSGSIYIYTAPSVRSELEHMQAIRERSEVTRNESLSDLLDKHIERTSAQTQAFGRSGDEKMIAIKKPPSPAPPPATGDGEVKSISFFTIDPHSRVELQFNNRAVKIRYMRYDDLMKIQTVQIPGRIKYKNGDRLNLKLNVSYQVETGNLETQIVEWVMLF